MFIYIFITHNCRKFIDNPFKPPPLPPHFSYFPIKWRFFILSICIFSYLVYSKSIFARTAFDNRASVLGHFKIYFPFELWLRVHISLSRKWILTLNDRFIGHAHLILLSVCHLGLNHALGKGGKDKRKGGGGGGGDI